MCDDNFPCMTYQGKTVYKIGCKMCSKAAWEIFTNKELGVYVARCKNCGYAVEVPPKKLLDNPLNAIPMRQIL